LYSEEKWIEKKTAHNANYDAPHSTAHKTS